MGQLQIATSLVVKLTKLYHYGQNLIPSYFWPTLTISLFYALHFLYHNVVLHLILITRSTIIVEHFYFWHSVTTSPPYRLSGHSYFTSRTCPLYDGFQTITCDKKTKVH